MVTEDCRGFVDDGGNNDDYYHYHEEYPENLRIVFLNFVENEMMYLWNLVIYFFI